MTTDTTTSPAGIIAALDRAATRIETTHDGVRMVWRRWGKEPAAGPVLVLFHGGSGSWLHWLRNVAALAQDYTLVVPDLPGYGESDTPPEPVTPDSMAAILKPHLDQAIGAQTPLRLAGFSLGAHLASHLAPLLGERLKHIVLVGVPGLNDVPQPPPIAPLRSWRKLPTEAEKQEAHRFNLGALMLHDPAAIDDLALLVQTRNSLQFRIRTMDIRALSRIPERLSQSSARLSTIWGACDVIAAPYLDERRALFERVRPGADFDVIPGAGHWVQFEAPEPFNRVLKQRLAEHG